MPRFGHWVIIAANAPTAFRAKHRETLVPTLKQLQRTQPDAVLRWFDGTRLWTSPAEANETRRLRHQGPKRPDTWRPGGEHKDPRARFELSRDEKRARFKRRLVTKGPRPAGPAEGPKRGPFKDDGVDRGHQKPAGFGPDRKAHGKGPGGPKGGYGRGPKRGPKQEYGEGPKHGYGKGPKHEYGKGPKRGPKAGSGRGRGPGQGPGRGPGRRRGPK